MAEAGTRERTTLRMKCTTQHCYLAPGSSPEMTAFMSSWSSLMTNPAPPLAPNPGVLEEEKRKTRSSPRQPPPPPIPRKAFLVHPYNDQKREVGDTRVPVDLQVGGAYRCYR